VAAHSFLRVGHGVRFSNHDTLEEYSRELASGRLPCLDEHLLTRADAMAEFMFLGLRLAEGISSESFEREFGSRMDDIYGSAIDELIRISLLQQEHGNLCLTRRGLLLSNQVFARFLP
jgi:oxygen-independent coproporphyrinogen-3 oxidase